MDLNIGMFTTANAIYWSQMPKIKDEIEKYADFVEKKLKKFGKVFNAGIVDSVKKARDSEIYFFTKDVDVVVIHAGSYGMSGNIIPCIRRLNIPIITLHLQPIDSFDEKSNSEYTLPKNPFSNAGEISAVLKRMGRKFFPFAGRLFNEDIWLKLVDIFEAINILKMLRQTNIGLIGNYYKGMCDLYVDETQLIYKFGVNIEILEIGDLRRFVEKVTEKEIENEYKRIENKFLIEKRIGKKDLTWSLKVAVGMKKLVKEYDLSALAFQYKGYPDSIEEKIAYSMTLGAILLTEEGIPCVVEGDIILTIAMLMLGFNGGGASQAELNVVDFYKGVNYINHGGPGDISISEGKPKLKWLDFYHGRNGSGVANEFSIKYGPITLLSLTQSDKNELKYVIAEGESVEGILLPNGNMNTRVKFTSLPDLFIEKWVKAGPSHHSAISVGHKLKKVELLAELLDIKIDVIK
jgi:L-arabinose isomerase